MTSSTLNLKSDVSPVAPVPAPTLRYNFWYQWRAVITATSLITCLVLTMLSTPPLERGYWAETLCRDLGWVCFLTALFIRMWASLYLGGRKGSAVVCDGPYSMCRNPLYIGTLLVMVSQVFFFQSLTIAAGIILPIIVYMIGVVPAEEHYLRLKLGDEYRAYCAKVPRWWPCFSQLSSPPVVEFNVKGVLQEVRRIGVWIWLPFLSDAVGILRAQPWWPHLFTLP